MIGDHLKLVENVPEGAAFCFDGKSKKQKIDQNDIIRELFDLGMGGSFYAQVVKVPEEYPVEDLSTVLLYERRRQRKSSHSCAATRFWTKTAEWLRAGCLDRRNRNEEDQRKAA